MDKKKVYKFPKKVTPNRVIVKGNHTYYTNKGERTHGHTIRDDDGISYARPRRGKPLKK